ncbi:sigma-70 family RNA polymerase sigma factor [Phytohabitans flavus]|uniref:DNA-directed RNA polymerase sigma-70 factor n=1 Tax=Phytohabitans flavus TaxID=1076124 RepID=A0A6F8XY95_9ACTN|nr:sigma-70 family RNA polymerase sigma factor [Phytohabitans flavus]BCB78780.1 DNA-directed RNA polymerase sigma-70 factor [Phytohabitans flavus]
MVDVELRLEEFRIELNGYCYRMLGSAFEAEDAVQETMVRAWKAFDKFEGRAALRSWLYRIATNVCLDMLGSAQRRARPMELGPSAKAREVTEVVPLPEQVWVGPVPDSRVVPDRSDPAEVAVARDSIRLAFVAALQHLPPKQRAVLILREVLAWSAQETAELLGLTVASVNSALQRARATIASADLTGDRLEPLDKDQSDLLSRYVQAFEAYDMASLAALLHEDATVSMPPIALWFRGHDEIRQWMLGPGAHCRGSRLVPTVANGLPAFGQYRPSGPDGRHEPWALIVLETSGNKITGINSFLDVERVFPLFRLPSHPDEAA